MAFTLSRWIRESQIFTQRKMLQNTGPADNPVALI
jgi:hypothetical protein